MENTVLFIYNSDYFSLPTNIENKIPNEVYDVKTILESNGSGDFWEVSNVDWKINEICLGLDNVNYQSIHTIVIDTRLEEIENIGLSLQLTAHLKFHKFANNELNQRRILLCGYEIPNLKNIPTNAKHFLSVLKTEGINLVTYSDIFYVKNNKIKIEYYLSKPVFRLELQEILNGIIISPNETTGRHSIANQWGALRLLMAAGGKEYDINYKLPQTTYFKYTLRKLDANNANTRFPNQLTPIFSISTFNKILLIDDEAQKGWKEVICKVLSIDEANVIAKEKYEDIADSNGNLLVNANEYDIILLDLRIPKDGSFNVENGIDLLMKIKKKYPASAVVIFTATNKAWNIQYIFEQGADGYFIKEAPETTSNEFSLRNYKHFEKTIKHCYDKTTLLKPYWENIVAIKNNLIIQDKGTMQIQERIKERLDMFFGLLKKGFERSEFDKSLFHYSDYELAFLTLWSVFNEVQEGIYDKAVTISSKNDWHLIGTTDYFLRENESSLLYDKHSTPHYTFSNPLKSQKGYTRLLSLQIAYFLNKKLGRVENDSLFDELYQLNEIRSHLFLIHNEDTVGYYDKTEKEKRQAGITNITPDSGGDIRKLFNLVAFVLTGDDTIKLS